MVEARRELPAVCGGQILQMRAMLTVSPKTVIDSALGVPALGLCLPILATPDFCDCGQGSCLGLSVVESTGEPFCAVGIAGR
jgi:hypothetical protein